MKLTKRRRAGSSPAPLTLSADGETVDARKLNCVSCAIRIRLFLRDSALTAFAGSSAGEKLSVGRRFESVSRLHYGAIAQRKSNGIRLISRLKRHRRSEVAAITEARHSLALNAWVHHCAERQGSRSALLFVREGARNGQTGTDRRS